VNASLAEELLSLSEDDLEDLETVLAGAAPEFEEAAPRVLRLASGMDKVRASYYRRFEKLTADLERKAITLRQFEKDAHDLISTTFRDVYRTHRGRTLTPGDEEWLSRASAEELRYASKFGKDIDAGKLKMPRQRRAMLYAQTLNGVALNAKIEALPDNARIWWRLGRGEHCISCLILAANSPYTKWNLPTTPRSGDTECLCITTPDSRILTRRGVVPIDRVVVGDEVLTHRMRWKKVLKTIRSRPGPMHIQARIVAPSGRSVGCTSDHRFFTPEGWVTIDGIDKNRLPVHTISHELLEMWTKDKVGLSERNVLSVQNYLSDLWGEKGSPRCRVRALWYETEGKIAVGGQILAQENSWWYSEGWKAAEAAIRRLVGRIFLHAQEGRENLRLLLAGWGEEVRLSLQVAVGEGAWSCSGRYGLASRQWRPLGRPLGEPDAYGEYKSPRHSLSEREESEMEGWEADVSVQDLWEGIFSLSERGKAEEVLQQEVSAGIPVLYDLEVEDDHSFIIEGLVAHNSNCKCRLEVKLGALSRAEREDAAEYAQKRDQSLNDMLRPVKPPRGMRLAEPPGLDPKELRKLAAERSRINAKLIDYLEERDIYDVPVWSVDDVLDERHVGRRAVQELFRHGIDGRSLYLVEKRHLAAMLDRYEKEVGELFSDEVI